MCVTRYVSLVCAADTDSCWNIGVVFYTCTNHTHTLRLGLIPALMRIHQESCTFRESAIRDLAISIQLLEKARSEYRAALLWMKNVSMKLQNPDYRDQLAKFREVCVCVGGGSHTFSCRTN